MSFFDNVSNEAIGLAVFVILLSVVAGILTTQSESQTEGSLAQNITNTGLTNVETFSDSGAQIVTIIVAVVILGAVMLIKKMRG